MEVDDSKSDLHTPLKYHGSWSYKAIKQLIKLHLRQLSDNNDLESNSAAVTRNYERMLRVASSKEAGISPNAVEKGVNGMLERVSSLVNNFHSSEPAYESMARTLARDVYDLTLKAFHPTRGISPNERLWSKTNLKYGQLLYEMNETTKLQAVIKDLLASTSSQSSGESDSMSFDNTAQSGTHAMEIAALQIQLYSRLKDTKKLREAYHSAMAVRGGIPHPRTLAMIQELGGKMHMDARNFDEASQAFFQAFKSYDEAGDRARLRCLKYLVMASMLHASSINPFDSHEARAHRDDPEIVAMTNLVQAFHNDDVKKFERILQKNEGRIMDDEFVRDHVADLLRTIRTQVILRSIGPYTRIRLARIAKDLNDIPVEDVESLLVSLILNGKLEGQIDQVNGIFVKAPRVGGNGSDVTTDKTHFSASGGSIESRTTAAIVQLTAALEHLTEMTTKVTARGSIIASQ
jgi:COP9 signalosome complex subunit 2